MHRDELRHISELIKYNGKWTQHRIYLALLPRTTVLTFGINRFSPEYVMKLAQNNYWSKKTHALCFDISFFISFLSLKRHILICAKVTCVPEISKRAYRKSSISLSNVRSEAVRAVATFNNFLIFFISLSFYIYFFQFLLLTIERLDIYYLFSQMLHSFSVEDCLIERFKFLSIKLNNKFLGYSVFRIYM